MIPAGGGGAIRRLRGLLTGTMDIDIGRNFLYPVFFNPPPTLTLQFSDQFAFRPTGSTEAAIIALLHTVTNLLLSNPYVIVISLDF